MQNRISKCQLKKNSRAQRLRTLLQLSPSDAILLDACARKTPQEVRHIMYEFQGTINPDTIRDKYLRTPLHIACSRKDNLEAATEIARILIEYGSDVNNGVGDIEGLQPLHMAVLAGNYHCVLMLLHEGVNIPASDPFRLTPLLLAKLKMDNLRQSQCLIHHNRISTKDDDNNYQNSDHHDNYFEWLSESAKIEYEDLKSITQVLVTHLAAKHVSTHGLPSYDSTTASSTTERYNDMGRYFGLSEFLFSKESSSSHHHEFSTMTPSSPFDEKQLEEITNKLALIGMMDSSNSNSNNSNGSHTCGSAENDVLVNHLIEKVKRLGLNYETVK